MRANRSGAVDRRMTANRRRLNVIRVGMLVRIEQLGDGRIAGNRGHLAERRRKRVDGNMLEVTG